MNTYQTTTLANQVRLVTTPLADTKSATLLVLFKVGSRYESTRLNGVSHFVEHLMFKGTKKRPTTLHLSKVLDAVGAEFNAFTSKEYTGYYIKVDVRHLDLAIDVLSDMLNNSKFAAAEIEREKGVIVEEINMYEDNPIMYIESLLEQTMFPANPLGWLISGSRETVRGLSREDLVNYRDKYYRGKNIVIGIGGQYQERHLKLIKAAFKFPSLPQTSQYKKITIKQAQPRVNLLYRESEQTQLALGFPAYHHNHPKLTSAEVMSVILGGNMSSRLFVKVRERNGLAYFIRSWLNPYDDTGSFVIQAGLDKTRVSKAVKMVMTELEKIKTGVSQAELDRAKEYLIGKMALNLEDSESVIGYYASQELLNKKVLTPDQKAAKIQAVTREQIIQVATDIFDRRRATLAIIGPVKGEEELISLLS